MIKMIAFFFFVSSVVVGITALWQGSQPGITTTLTADLAANETAAVGVASTGGFLPTNSRVVINSELIRYQSTLPAGSCPAPIPANSPCFTTLERGVGTTNPAEHTAGRRVYDVVTGTANLGQQVNYSIVQTDTESGIAVNQDPPSLTASFEQIRSGFLPTFLTGNWTILNWVFMFFLTLFGLIVALLMVSLVRGVRLF